MPSIVFATTAGGTWSQGNVIRQGAKSLYEGILNTGDKVLKGTASFKPNVAQVSKQIAKVGAVGAVTTAVDMLLGGVDWVLDPANNRVIYYDILSSEYECSTSHISLSHAKSDSRYFYSKDKSAVADFMCKKTFGQGEFTGKFGKLQGRNLSAQCKNDDKLYGVDIYCDIPPSYLPLDVVSAQVISNAESKDEEAVQFVATVADANITQSDKKEQWERTKAPAVPGTNTGMNTGTEEATNTGTGEATADPTAEPTEKDLPAFCGWAPLICDMAGKVSEAIDWAKAEPEIKDEPTKIDTIDTDIGDWRSKANTNYVSSSNSCPADLQIPINWGGISTSINISYQPFCYFASIIKPAVILGAWISGLMIVTGGRSKE